MKEQELKTFFSKHQKVALGFSGGVDSSYLLYMAMKNSENVKAYFIKTPFQPQFELEDAMRMAEHLHADMTVIHYPILQEKSVAANDPMRCYHCKSKIFGILGKQADKDEFTVILDGTNASDDLTDRPGTQALEEQKVLSPLRLCGMTKEEIRLYSKEAGLFTWNKPAYACLATRIPTGTAITALNLDKVERSESFLSELGFSDFRVRLNGNTARIQIQESQFAASQNMRTKIEKQLANDFIEFIFELR